MSYLSLWAVTNTWAHGCWITTFTLRDNRAQLDQEFPDDSGLGLCCLCSAAKQVHLDSWRSRLDMHVLTVCLPYVFGRNIFPMLLHTSMCVRPVVHLDISWSGMLMPLSATRQLEIAVCSMC